ncbi:MAG: DNA modification methylase [Armatimonadota bacterium]|nr:DNA modification methylase [Armatimonadota bacterium]
MAKAARGPDLSHIAEPLRPLAVPIERLRTDPANARKHPERNLEAVKASLARYGQRKPVVVNKETGIIEAGNATWEAARALGWRHLAVVYVQDDPTTASGYAVADNRTAELALWDEEALARQLVALEAVGELASTGFDLEELRALTTPPVREEFDLQKALAEIGTPRIRPGEVWQLGRHRLACGDSRDPATWARLLAGQRADLVVTSPPYNVGMRYATYRDRAKREEYFGLIRDVGQRIVEHLAPGRFVAWNTGVTSASAPHWHPVLLEECGLTFIRQITWIKQGIPWPLFPLTMKRKRARYYTPNWRHEAIYLLEAPGERARELPAVPCPACEGKGMVHGHVGPEKHGRVLLMVNGEIEIGGPIAPAKKYANDVWYIAQQSSSVGIPTLGKKPTGFKRTNVVGKRNRHMVKAHPATFPVELPRAVMTFLAAEGELVVDPFVGAGATIIACEEMGREGAGIDIDPIYCELTIGRWEQQTKRAATKISKP